MATNKGVVAFVLLFVVFLTGLLGGPSLIMDTLPTADSLPSQQYTASMIEREFELDISVLPPSQPHDPLWYETYGGSQDERGASVIEVSTGGYAIVGCTKSYSVGLYDFYLVRTNVSGNLLWDKSYGGTLNDAAVEFIECSTGGFAIVGWTESFGAGGRDIWLVRTDASGNHLWNKTFGGGSWERGDGIVECSGGGFALIGTTESYGAGDKDLWLIRTDASGNHQWNKTLGGTAADRGWGLVEFSGGGFIITGETASSGAGGADLWLICTDASGNHQWNVTYGGGLLDRGYEVVEVSSGGFAIAAETYSFSAGNADAWLLRTDSSGNHLWNRTWGGVWHDWIYDVVEVSDGSFAASGVAATSVSASSYDVFMVRVDSTGTELWSRTYGGGDFDEGKHMIEVSAGGYLIAAETMSYGGADQMMLLRIPADIVSEAPVWVEVPTDQVIEFGASFSYDLNATDPSGIDDWWLNDTSNFDINTDGVVTNNIALEVQVYGLQVWVNDTVNDVLSANFSITVQDTTDPTWDEAPTNQVVELGQSFNYNLNASDLSGIDHYWINDTVHFTVDTTGLITNVTDLAVGSYDLEVRAYDPYDNYCSATFTVTVEDTTPPTWEQIPANQLSEYGEPFSYNLNASDLSGLDTWWLDDNSYFVINNQGVITNTTSLSIGVYELTVWVNDTRGNPRSATFTVAVEDNTMPTWVISPTNQTLQYSQELSYLLVAWDLTGINEWTISDTTNFALSVTPFPRGSTCHLTSLGILDPGTYELTITVSDSYNNIQTETISVTVTLRLQLQLSGSFDFLLKEDIYIRFAGLLIDRDTGNPISGAAVTIQVYNPSDTLILSVTLLEEGLGSGVYTYTMVSTLKDLKLPKGIYLVYGQAVFGGIEAVDMIQFHIDPPGDTGATILPTFVLIGFAVLTTVSVALVWHRRRIRLSQ